MSALLPRRSPVLLSWLRHARGSASLLAIPLLVGCYDGVEGIPTETGETPVVDDSDTVPPDDSDTDNDPPLAPTVRFANTAPRTADALVATVVGAEPAFTYTWSWTLDGVPQTDLSTDTVPAERTTRGQVWAVSVTAAVEGRVSAPGTASVTVQNTPPEVSVEISPTVPNRSTALVAVPTATDADGDEVTFAYRWAVDGAATALNGVEVPAGIALRGQTWQVTVTPSDASEAGPPATASVLVANTAPVATAATLSPANVRTTGSVQSQISRSDPDGDALTNQITWFRQRRDEAAGSVLAGQTGTTLNGQFFDKGDQIWFQVVVNDGSASSAPLESNRVTVANTPPDFAGVTLGPAQASGATPLTCAPTGFVDIDSDPEGWRYAWTIDGQVVVGADGPTLTGGYSRGDSVVCEVRPFDGDDEGPMLPSAPLSIGNTPPTLTAARLNTLAPSESDTLTVTVEGASDPDGDNVTTSIAWFVNGGQVGVGSSLSPALFRAGDQVWAVATPSDGAASGAPVRSETAAVANTPPTCVSLRLQPESPDTDDTLAAFATGSDADNHTVTFTWRWRVGGAVVQEGSTSTLPGTFFARGQSVTVEAISFDGFSTGTSCVSDPVTVRNTAPVGGSASLTPAQATELSTLTCAGSGATDLDGDALSYTYTWTVDGAPIAATTATLTGAAFSHGQAVICRATPSDGTDIGSAVASPAVVIQNTAPTVQRVTLSTNAPGMQTTIIATPVGGADVDGDPITWRYAWLIDGVVVDTDDRIEPGQFVQGDLVSVRVTPFDGFAEGNPVTSSAVQIRNAPPVLTSVRISPVPADAFDTLTAVWTATDDDGDLLTASFRWFVEGSEVFGETGATLAPVWFDRGEEVEVEAVVTDGIVSSNPLVSDGVVIANLAPTLLGAQVLPPIAYEATTLTCSPFGAADAEGDPIRYFYIWRVNGVPVSESSTLTGSSFRKGDSVWCQVAPDDSQPGGLGLSVTAPTITILNTPPTVASASLSTTTPNESTVLTVTPRTPFDIDGDSVSYRYAWSVNGATVSTAASIDGSLFNRGDSVLVTVTPFDGTDTGASVNAGPAVVQNTPPVLSALSITPTQPRITDTLTVTPIAIDGDGDVITYTFSWIVNGQTVQTGPGRTLSPGAFDAGDDVSVVGVPSDGVTTGLQASSPLIRIQNTAPSITGAEVSPTTVYESTVLSCTPSGWNDIDGDAPGYVYRWYVNSVADAGTTTLTGTRFRRGDAVQCEVTPYDGFAFGTPVRSAPVTVLNSAPTVTSATLDRIAPVEGNTVGVLLSGVNDVDSDTLTNSYVWFVNGVQAATSATLPSTLFARGDTIYAVVTVSDGSLTASVTSNTVTVANSLPVMGPVSLSPTSPTTLDSMTATYNATDADGDPISYQFVWTLDGVVVPDVNSDVLPESAFGKNRDIRVTVTPNDGIANGPSLASSTVRSRNLAPTLASASMSPTSFHRGSGTLTCSASGAADLDGDTVSIEYLWLVNGVQRTTASQLDTGTLARGDSVQCGARPYDGEEYGNTVLSASSLVSNAPPSITTVSLTNLSPNEGESIGVSSVITSDPDGDTVTLAYTWRVNGNQVSNGNQIDSTLFNRGDEIILRITGTDSLGSTTSYASAPITVVNAPPTTPAAASISPGLAYRNSTLSTSSTATDPDGDTVSLVYTWTVNGVSVQSGAGTTLAPGPFVRGNSVGVSIVAVDSLGLSSAARTVSPVTILNAAPTVPGVTITPADPTPGVDPLVCTVTSFASDPDGDAVTYDIRWRQATLVVGAVTRTSTTATVAASLVGSGEIWTCDVRAYDGTAYSSYSAGVTIAPSTLGRNSCAEARFAGASQDGVYRLGDDPAWGEVAGWCDQTTAGGGWTRVVRTGRDAGGPWGGLDVGQSTWDLVSSWADVGAEEGVYAPFETVRGLQDVLIKAVDGPQAGRWAAFSLWEDASGLTLREVLESCRDEVAAPGDDAAFPLVATLGHATAASGVRALGDLAVADAVTGSARPLDWVQVCGVRTAGDNGVSYLSFSADRLDQAGPWSPTLPGTLWAFGSGAYGVGAEGHLGTSAITGFAGWYGDAFTAPWHAATYEIYVR